MYHDILCIVPEGTGIWHLRDRLGVHRGMIYSDHMGSLRPRELAGHAYYPAAECYFNWSWFAYPDTDEIFYRPGKGTARDFDDAFGRIINALRAAEAKSKLRLPQQGDLFDLC